MFGRGVITSRTTLSPNSTTDWISLRSSSSIKPFFGAGGDQRFDVLGRGGRLFVRAAASSVRSISDWKKLEQRNAGPRDPAP